MIFIEYQGQHSRRFPKDHDSFSNQAGNVTKSSATIPFKDTVESANYGSIRAWERVNLLVDPNSFQELDSDFYSFNPLDFPDYESKLERAEWQSDLREAIITGNAKIGGTRVVLGVMESKFMMGSMGAVVGEKVVRAIDHAISNRCPLIIFACSGGARMQEGIISLMQMAKTSAALARLHKAGILFVSVLTHPTTGGVLASFASLADIIIAEAGALVGFTGSRVIRDAISQKMPEGIQSSEFHYQHGMIDLVVDNTRMKETIINILELHPGGKYAPQNL